MKVSNISIIKDSAVVGKAVVTMTALKKEAVQMIEKMQDDDMIQVVAFLKNINLSRTGKDRNRAMQGLEVLKSFAGALPEDFDYEKELSEASIIHGN